MEPNKKCLRIYAVLRAGTICKSIIAPLLNLLTKCWQIDAGHLPVSLKPNCFPGQLFPCNYSPLQPKPLPVVDGARMQTVQNRRICPVAQIAAWQFVCPLNDNNLWWAGRKLGVEPNHFSNLRSDHHRAHLPEKRDKNIFFSSKPLFTLVAKVGPLRFVRMTDDWRVWLIISFADGVFGLIEIWRQNGRSTAELIGRGVARAIIPSRDLSQISKDLKCFVIWLRKWVWLLI